MEVRLAGALGIAALALTFASAPASGAPATTPRCLGERATIVGTAGDDQGKYRLVGTPGRDVIVGLGGSDAIYGRGGDDRICGKGGGDYLAGGQGDDRLFTGPGNNTVTGDAGDDVLQGGNGADDNANYVDSPRGVYATIGAGYARGQGRDKLRSGIDELFGSPERDTLIGDGRGQLIAGFEGDDRIRGGGGDDLLAGGAGSDRMSGGSGLHDIFDDLEFGGPNASGGLDVDLGRGISTGHGRDRLRGMEGVYASVDSDHLVGSDGSNILVGDAGDDTVAGGRGPDVVEGDLGMDKLDGGPGTDYSSSFGSPTAVTVNLETGTLTGTNAAKDTDSLRNIEDAQGSGYDDTIIGDDGPNALRGDPGGDEISGGGGDDLLLGGCDAAPSPHFFWEDVFDCSSPKAPDSLDGGDGDDRCGDATAIVACEHRVR